jgi:uncharacterized protein YndB with AHSA1/START domain
VKRVTHETKASPDEVWRVLADGWLYPLWVVGATRMREVEDEWPVVGSRLHHSVGVWPMVINDHTEVLEVAENRMLKLQARAWPGGEAEVTLRLVPQGNGTELSIEEDLVSGPGRIVPAPVRAALLQFRNRECLQRLALLAERRS